MFPSVRDVVIAVAFITQQVGSSIIAQKGAMFNITQPVGKR